MTDYTLSEAQIEALAHEEALLWGVTEDEWAEGPTWSWTGDARQLTNLPAFKSIIRAAQADAWAVGYELGLESQYGRAYPSGTSIDPDPNPYEAADV